MHSITTITTTIITKYIRILSPSHPITPIPSSPPLPQTALPPGFYYIKTHLPSSNQPPPIPTTYTITVTVALTTQESSLWHYLTPSQIASAALNSVSVKPLHRPPC
ncbi:hypothetical protein E2C01_100778 [Portunus trituberculatus]|uniref:Uncharacterized protein n=1 Tax=Portunus trituberculatus TaxID=210409 RepID=A0A5B7KEG6_PORTR|nr:hypothetical protein [Portunus trituberculatus]